MAERIDESDGLYEGNISDGEKDGQGCYLWYNGNFYYGEWAKGKMEGSGMLFYANGGVIKGRFAAGRLSGLGRGMYSNGDTYVGMWRDGMFSGRGLFYVRTRNHWQLGEFVAGNLVSLIDQGEGRPSSLGIKRLFTTRLR